MIDARKKGMRRKWASKRNSGSKVDKLVEITSEEKHLIYAGLCCKHLIEQKQSPAARVREPLPLNSERHSSSTSKHSTATILDNPTDPLQQSRTGHCAAHRQMNMTLPLHQALYI
jgi:hypothetical protein